MERFHNCRNCIVVFIVYCFYIIWFALGTNSILRVQVFHRTVCRVSGINTFGEEQFVLSMNFVLPVYILWYRLMPWARTAHNINICFIHYNMPWELHLPCIYVHILYRTICMPWGPYIKQYALRKISILHVCMYYLEQYALRRSWILYLHVYMFYIQYTFRKNCILHVYMFYTEQYALRKNYISHVHVYMFYMEQYALRNNCIWQVYMFYIEQHSHIATRPT